MNKIKENVKDILTWKTDTRNSDKLLIAAYIRIHHSEYIYGDRMNLEDMINMTSFESITRARRAIQREEYDQIKATSRATWKKIDYENTKYMPTDKAVLQKRRLLCEEFKNHYRK